MEEVFRFLMLRPPELKRAEADAIILRPSPSLAAAIAQAFLQWPAANALAAAARQPAKAALVAALEDLDHGPQIAELLRLIERSAEDSAAAAVQAAKQAFGAHPAQSTKLATLASDHQRLSDTLVRRKYSGRGGHDLDSLERACKALSLLHLIEDAPLGFSPREFLRRTLVVGEPLSLPLKVAGSLNPRVDPTPADAQRLAGERRIAELQATLQGYATALAELTSVAPRDVETSVPAETTAPAAPAKVGARSGARATPAPSSRARTAPKAVLIPGGGRDLVAVPLMLSRAAVLRLSQETTDLLAQAGADLAVDPLPEACARLLQRMQRAGSELYAIEKAWAGEQRLLRIGSGVYEVDKPPAPPVGPSATVVLSLPTSHGALQPVGVADLLVVRQTLERYEARELSHIETVLRGEHKSREHKRSRSTEETTTVEQEITREQERDQQTTERFEIQRETSSILREDLAVQLGTSLSGSYGPCVDFTASADLGMNKSKEEATKQASTYSKETTQRAASRVTERVRRESTFKVTETFEETNVHEIDNRENAENLAGMYQWVEKVYEAQVWNYGRRMMFDFIVPEPASFLLHAVASQPVAGANVVKPVPFTKTAHELDEVNYFSEAQRYDAQGVEPPPEPFIKVAKTFEGADDRTDRGALTAVGELPIPEGYSAVKGVVSVAFNEWKEDASIHVMLGSAWHAFEAKKDYIWSPSLPSHPGMIPIALRTYGVAIYVAVFDIHCKRTARAMDAWRLKTHAAIKQGYLKQLQDYEEKVTAAKNQAAESAGQARAPTDNRTVERTELKRLAISMLTAQHFDTFGAIEKGAFGYPQIDLAEADDEGRYIRFFEQAFEWEHMMYVFYPYFWGRKAGWRASALRQDDDAQFAEFLRAGAARVVLPVRLGFDLAVAHFLETGQIWQGGNPPLVTSPLYLNIVDEIKERTGAPGAEVAQGEPWEVRVPTTLVTLRNKPGLPSWSKGEDGAWTEDA